jgi:hypothetical protein
MGGTRKVAGTAADRSQQCEERQKKGRWKMTDPGVNNSTENLIETSSLHMIPYPRPQFQLVNSSSKKTSNPNHQTQLEATLES